MSYRMIFCAMHIILSLLRVVMILQIFIVSYFAKTTRRNTGKGIVHGLVNVAAFLAHAMSISIKYNVCDK